MDDRAARSERERDIYWRDRERERKREREREAGERKRADREKLAFSRLKINMHGSDSETFILPGLISF